MEYQHTQKSPLGWIMPVIGLSVIIITSFLSKQVSYILISSIFTILLIFASLFFTTLTVRDENQFLAIEFGPLPLFSKRISFAEITRVEQDRSNILDGWGINYIPGRGTIYNIWGFDCVRIEIGDKSIRIGTDDTEALVSFLENRIRS